MAASGLMQRRTVNFVSFGNVAVFLSIVIIAVGFATVYFVFGGLSLGIDFKSGVSMQVQFKQSPPPSTEEVRAALSEFGTVSVQQVSSGTGRYLIKSDLLGEGSDEAVNALQSRLFAEFEEDNVEILEIAFIGPRYSGSIARQSIVLTVSALALILVYIWIRFRFYYAVSAILALMHDVILTVIFLGVTRIELSTTTVAAILTIVGYSLNDTVVIFDRIRENTSTYMHDTPLKDTANTSIRQSLSRTLITSLTTLLAVSAIYVFSTGPIQDFALCMIFGIVVGTYSSICIATPVLVAWAGRVSRRSASHAAFAAAKRIRRSSKDAGGGTAPLAIASKSGVSPSGGEGERSTAAGRGGGSAGAGKQITVDTARIRQEFAAKRQQQEKKKKKKKNKR